MKSSKRRLLGMAGAAIWLVAISTAFTVLSLIMIGTAITRIVLAGVFIAVIAYITIGAAVIRTILRFPGAIPPRSEEERVAMRRFVPVVVAEVIAIMLVNVICGVTQHVELLVPLDLLIVGIHFLPLAWIFQVPRYYVMGGLFCLVILLTLVLVPAKAQVGAAASWFVIPTFGCTTVAWATAAFNLRKVWQSVSLIHNVG
ncbi:MAG: hypothetical protein LAO55_14520 [Acidobacteriia bacterium]|nr:hypothetical protein [Terriglobia bacterium]